MITLHYASAALLAQYGLPVPGRTARTIVAVKDDTEVVGTAGVYTDHHRAVMYADLSDTVRSDKRSMVKAIRMLRPMVERMKMPVHALADPDIPHSAVLLEHIGFKHLTGELYQWQP